MSSRRMLILLLALVLVALGAGLALADVPVPEPEKDDGGCLAAGLPWALPPIGLSLVFLVRHRTRKMSSPDQDPHS